MFQEVIADITMKMGSGMCVFLENEVGSMSQWDEVLFLYSNTGEISCSNFTSTCSTVIMSLVWWVLDYLASSLLLD